jgi:hypothetical protein
VTQSFGSQIPVALDSASYDVCVEVGALRWESATPLFARYRAPLLGEIDGPWLDCYERASLDSAEFSRFRLDPPTRTVSFTCRMSDGPAEVAAVLRRLELLVAFVNRSARRSDAEKEAVGEKDPGEALERGARAK